jgi:hypothetical protein
MIANLAKKSEREIFPAAVAVKLKTYVYRLIDPRNGETFYVGKGRGNRVFSHIYAEQNLEGDEIDNKLKRIREIRLAGLEVGHVIHRHGLDDRTAFDVSKPHSSMPILGLLTSPVGQEALILEPCTQRRLSDGTPLNPQYFDTERS